MIELRRSRGILIKKYYFSVVRKIIRALIQKMSITYKKRIFMDVGALLGFGHFLPCENEVQQGMFLIGLHSKDDVKIAIDAGAYKGEYSDALLKNFPNLRLIQFEPNPTTNAFLVKKFKNDKRVKTERIGLAAKSGKWNFVSASDFDASAHAIKTSPMGSFQIRTISLDKYLAQTKIKKVDWLKVDVEGLDFEVLKGFKKNVSKTLIIQFEISLTSLGQAKLLDFYELLHPTHDIYRVSPNGVPIAVKEYESSDENFWGTNYLAVRKN